MQILAGLLLALFAAIALLAVTSSRLSSTERAAERRRTVKVSALLFQRAMQESPEDATFAALAEGILGTSAVTGCEYEGRKTWSRGIVGVGESVQGKSMGGVGQVRLWLRPLADEPHSPYQRLFILYGFLVAVAFLLIAYVVLTVWIVRPIDSLTVASQRLSDGHLNTVVPAKGPREIAGLASSFNEMAGQLRRDQEMLLARVEELTALTDELTSTQEQVIRGERLASVGRLTAGVAHEIGNPLAAIRGLIDLVAEGDLEPDEQKEFLARVQQETERIHRIIRDLLDFSRKESSVSLEDANAVADVKSVIEDAVALVAPQQDLGSLRIVQRYLHERLNVKAEGNYLTQVVLNLLLNAADAIEGEGEIDIEVARIDNEVCVVVTDSGPGIDPKIAEHLFEPFVTSKNTGHGTGLGLAVCNAIVERFEGRISASNSADGGARFEVRLPSAERAPQDT